MIKSQLYITIIFTCISINLFSQLREGIHDGWRCDPENPLTLESDANSFIIILNETEELKHFSMSEKPLKIIIECSGQIYKDADENGKIPITRLDIYTMDQEFMLLEKSYKRLNINIGYVKIIRKGKFSKVEIVLYRNSENDGKPFYSEMRNLIVRKSL